MFLEVEHSGATSLFIFYEPGTGAGCNMYIVCSIPISSNTDSTANAHALARYASLCQEINIVPIVEPEVLMDGIHTIDLCAKITDKSAR